MAKRKTDEEIHTSRLKRLAIRILTHTGLEHRYGEEHVLPTVGTLFDMGTWGFHNGDHKPEDSNFCGTAACALGHAALDPANRKQGMELAWNRVSRCSYGSGWEASISFKGEIGDAAGALFFGLSYEESQSLFYATNADKSWVVRKLVELAFDRCELRVGDRKPRVLPDSDIRE